MMAGQNASRSRAEAGLRTEKLREQDLRRRAAALGPVPIHVYFQNGLILQVTIRPSGCHYMGAFLSGHFLL